jgi:capsular polysaccharide biosynthesis protein
MLPRHAPLHLHDLVSHSIIEEALKRNPNAVRNVRAHLGSTAHVLSVENVLYVPSLGLQIVDDRLVPAEGIVDPSNLAFLQHRFRSGADSEEDTACLSCSFSPRYVDEEVCILSNVFSRNFSHFTEELFKVLILERAGYTGPYVYTALPSFAIEFWDALGLDRRRLTQVSSDPVVFRSALYTTNLNFLDLSKCVDVFFELRERMFSATAEISSPYGSRLWLDRGADLNPARALVNSEEVDSCLEGYGFTRLDPGGLPLLEQIAAARNADVIAGPHGSAFMHCAYMKERSTVMEIFSPNYLDGQYSVEICRVLGHRYIMIVGHNLPVHGWPYPHGTAVEVPLNQLGLALQSLPK